MGAKRIGHAVREAEDPALLAQLAAEGVTCELCPTSNLNTGVYKEYAEHPLPAFLEAGVPVTLNSDNMVVSMTDVGREIDLMVDAFSFTDADVEGMLLLSVEASFAEPELKESLRARIRSCFDA